MCGLTVFAGLSDRSTALAQSLAAIAHRGPDSQGARLWPTPAGGCVGLGHVRLSIIDTSAAGFQPMLSADGQVAMVFNGEIYNHLSLREHLPGHVFSGHSDSELLLELFARQGAACFSLLRGMFAAAFLHIQTGELTLVRDPMGIKPLYWHNGPQGLAVSSEIRGLRPFMPGPAQVCRSSLFEFLCNGFVYEPHTGLTDVHKVPAGSYLRVLNGEVAEHRYFSLEQATRQAGFSGDLISQAVVGQLEADVKLGVFFSGGLDSSVIAAVAKRDNLFIRYDAADMASSGKVDDAYYAEKISARLGLQLSVLDLAHSAGGSDAFIQSMRAVAQGTEELISDYTYVAAEELAHAARRAGYKVMLSGLGGDEAFVGYPRYRLLIEQRRFGWVAGLLSVPGLAQLLRRVPAAAKKVDRFLAFAGERRFALAYSRLVGYLDRAELQALWTGGDLQAQEQAFEARCAILLKGFESSHPLIKALVLDFHGYLSHNLMVADKSSMKASLEVRVPLLEQDLYVGYLGALRQGTEAMAFGKTRLKQLLLRHLPRALVERPKTGFNPPLDGEIRRLGADRILAELKASRLGAWVDINAAQAIVERHFRGEVNQTYKIWQLLYLAYWLEDKALPA